MFWLLPGLVACAPDALESAPPPVAPECGVYITDTVPAPGSSDAFWLDPIVVHLSAPDPSATVDAPFAGDLSVSDDGLELIYWPDEPLAPSTEWSMTVTTCAGTAELDFSTSAYGEPVGSPEALIGRTWSLDVADGEFELGGDAAKLAAGLFDRPLLVEVVGAAEAEMTVRLGVGDANGAQDPCARTVDITGIALQDDPRFSFSAESFTFDAYAGAIAVSDLLVEGTVSPDGSGLAGIRIAGDVDLREVAAVLDTGSLCELTAQLGTVCEPCLADGVAACVRVAVGDLEGFETDAVVDPVEATCE